MTTKTKKKPIKRNAKRGQYDAAIKYIEAAKLSKEGFVLFVNIGGDDYRQICQNTSIIDAAQYIGGFLRDHPEVLRVMAAHSLIGAL